MRVVTGPGGRPATGRPERCLGASQASHPAPAGDGLCPPAAPGLWKKREPRGPSARDALGPTFLDVTSPSRGVPTAKSPSSPSCVQDPRSSRKSSRLVYSTLSRNARPYKEPLGVFGLYSPQLRLRGETFHRNQRDSTLSNTKEPEFSGPSSLEFLLELLPDHKNNLIVSIP